MTTEEGSLALPDGIELYTKTWKANGTPRAIIALIHGFSDHCNAYHDFFPTLASEGIEIRSFDQRGWGRSVKQSRDRGNTGSTTQVLSDIHVFLQSLPPQPNTPLFLMGHSMGGGQVLSYIFRPDSPYNQSSQAASRPNFAGVLLYSPLIAIHPSSRPSKLTVAAGRVVAKLIPHKQRYSPLDANLISRNEATVKDFVDDELCHDTGTFEGLAGMLDRGIWLEGMFEGGNWVKSDLPFWFGHGDGDRITSPVATEDFVKGLQKKGGDVKFETYEGAYHRLNAELPETSAKFVADVRDWVLGKAPGTENLGVPNEASGPEAQSEPALDTADHGDGVAAEVSADDKAKL